MGFVSEMIKKLKFHRLNSKQYSANGHDPFWKPSAMRKLNSKAFDGDGLSSVRSFQQELCNSNSLLQVHTPVPYDNIA